MPDLVIRNIDPELFHALKLGAVLQQKTLRQYVSALLARSLAQNAQPTDSERNHHA